MIKNGRDGNGQSIIYCFEKEKHVIVSLEGLNLSRKKKFVSMRHSPAYTSEFYLWHDIGAAVKTFIEHFLF